MHKRAAFISMLLMLTVTLWAQVLPRPITSYYEDWNYVVRNSTEHQRAALWSAYRRHEEAVLSGVEQELLVRMNRIVDATSPQHFSMPMLLAGTASPVATEILVPSEPATIGEARILVRVKVMQVITRGIEAGGEPSAHPAGGTLLRMCQYTDEWRQRGGQWKVLRSPIVWVDAE